tara:strand:- start:289 stop:489 length:201 start_codon:yes stop_codon:yes gene_type:complete
MDSILETLKELISLVKQDYVRINISVSTKGVHTYDATIKGFKGRKHVLAESDALVKDLEERYPRPA